MSDARAQNDKPLKLRAYDPADMDVVAALLQDALVPLGDMKYLAEEQRFVLVANRFRWHGDPDDDALPDAPEARPEGGDAAFVEEAGDEPPFERVNSGLCFDKVERVRFRGLTPGAKDEILSLLTITAQPGAITLIFAGEAAVRLEVAEIRCHLHDIGDPWPTRWRPRHEWEGPVLEGPGEGPEDEA